MSLLQDLQELQKKFPGLELIKLDVQSDASIKQAFEHISKAVDDEGLNLLMNNSAILGKVRLSGLKEPINLKQGFSRFKHFF